MSKDKYFRSILQNDRGELNVVKMCISMYEIHGLTSNEVANEICYTGGVWSLVQAGIIYLTYPVI